MTDKSAKAPAPETPRGTLLVYADDYRHLTAEVERLTKLRDADREEYRRHVKELIPEVERLKTEVERLREELDTWKSVFPDIAPASVLPDRSLLEADNERLRAALKDCAQAAAAHHAENVARTEWSGSSLAQKKARAISARSGVLTHDIKAITRAALKEPRT